ncbi:hypothetical protein KIW84_054000 [Lathyrus oleraceus]|uniref:Uncharacterized protein n=1 Tax=Pisum sativum TaxID=3888 RepID=A0A9D4WWG6_PEA|nr:hypothetical protein KIW84_054000 [Pisum sativum]
MLVSTCRTIGKSGHPMKLHIKAMHRSQSQDKLQPFCNMTTGQKNKINNKERSIILKQQLKWDRALETFNWFIVRARPRTPSTLSSALARAFASNSTAVKQEFIQHSIIKPSNSTGQPEDCSSAGANVEKACEKVSSNLEHVPLLTKGFAAYKFCRFYCRCGPATYNTASSDINPTVTMPNDSLFAGFRFDRKKFGADTARFQKKNADTSTTGLSLNNLVDKTPSDLLDIGQNTSYSRNINFPARSINLNSPISKYAENSCDKSSVRDDMFNFSLDPHSLKSAQIQPSQNQIATGFHDNPTINSESSNPTVLHDDVCPSLTLPVDSPDSSRNNVSFKNPPSFLNDFITNTGQMVDQFKHEYSALDCQKLKAKF